MISAEKIPNNVGLSDNKRLQRALEHWQPQYIKWWRDMGPQGFQDRKANMWLFCCIQIKFISRPLSMACTRLLTKSLR